MEQAGSIEEAGKATVALLPLFPIMIAVTLLIIILQVRSMSARVMVFLTAPRRGRAYLAPVQPAVRHQCAGRADRPVRYLDAHHLDPDRTNPP